MREDYFGGRGVSRAVFVFLRRHALWTVYRSGAASHSCHDSVRENVPITSGMRDMLLYDRETQVAACVNHAGRRTHEQVS